MENIGEDISDFLIIPGIGNGKPERRNRAPNDGMISHRNPGIIDPGKLVDECTKIWLHGIAQRLMPTVTNEPVATRRRQFYARFP